MPMAELLSVTGLSKSFGSISVLENIGFAVPTKSVVGLVGENGAGKSTLFNILTGLVRADAGTIVYRGKPFQPRSYKEAFELGVSRVFQEQSLVLNVPVYENLVLSQERRFTRFGQLVDHRAMIKVAEKIIEDAGLDVDVRRNAGSYDFSKRQAIEIARACMAPRHLMGIEDPLVLLDEPTSALDREDETAFFDLLVRMKRHASFIFVSHRLTEVRDISDTIHVMKDGRIAGTLAPQEAEEKILHGLMVGRARADDYYHTERQRVVDDAPIVCRVNRLSGVEFSDVSFDLRAGEIIGIGGLLDSGKSALGKAIAGVIPPSSGTVALGEMPPQKPDIADFVQNGLGYVPAERLVEGIIPSLGLAINLTLPSADQFSRFGVWQLARERSAADMAIKRFAIRSGSATMPLRNLSGGNQQKVVLARWLRRDLKVLVLDNPTRGVDAGAKEEIYMHIRALTEQGVGVVAITDELTELIGMANRILIMQRGRVVAEISSPPSGKPSEHDLIPHMLPGQALTGAVSQQTAAMGPSA
jgi:ribose transport system ATP-binding protein